MTLEASVESFLTVFVVNAEGLFNRLLGLIELNFEKVEVLSTFCSLLTGVAQRDLPIRTRCVSLMLYRRCYNRA